ncbi:hypothetical protein PUMCH_000273 [Australozyma saopauloensis]|uniref:Regulator of phospholipase D SRF1 n=1 Tax=Australozyma saopauloensis TaxID=291208 RepID=A0AAX4H4C7_9ASCO|nr:hypothetical protein PUMCH_000273 [[Candida] saopauloensis]
MPGDNHADRNGTEAYFGNATVDESGNFVLIDPFRKTQLASYSLKPKVVPNYVLAKMAQAHQREQSQRGTNSDLVSPELRSNSTTSSDKKEEYTSFMNDPFNRTLNHGYHDLLLAVKQPSEFTLDQLSLDQSLSQSPISDSPWGGDDRLRQAIMGTSAGDNLTGAENKGGFFSRLFLSKRKHADDTPRVRSKAGYWMLDEKRKDLAPTLQRIFVQNPLVPLLLRIMMLVFSTCSLALAINIFVNLRKEYDNVPVLQQPGTVFAIVVQSFAIIYIVYVAYDEYSGKPLGLRDPLGKLKLIMLDVFFIIFCSANLSLAFHSLFDTEWVCMAQPELGLSIHTLTVGFLCRRQRALVFFLLLIVFLWLLTFAISIIRVVDRVSSGPRSG